MAVPTFRKVTFFANFFIQLVGGLSMKQEQKGMLRLVLPVGLAASMALGVALSTSAVADEFGPYATDTAKNAVRNSAGECWRISDGDTNPREECGDVKAAPAPAPAPVAVDGDDDGDGVPNSRDKCPGTRKGVKVNADGCEIVASTTLNVTSDDFDFDSSKLKPNMKKQLDAFVSDVKASPGDERLEVVGHTDSVGTDAYNQKLSERRAQAVADYLATQGVAKGNMGVSGKGESSPIADNATKEGRAKNRRVEINTN
jgi:OmpA-OmpF porin, OOP family